MDIDAICNMLDTTPNLLHIYKRLIMETFIIISLLSAGYSFITCWGIE